MNELKMVMENIIMSEDAKNKIITRTKNYKKEKYVMSKKKIVVIAAAAALVMGIVAYAASGIVTSRSSHSSSIPEYTSLPTAEQCANDIGYSPVLKDEFSNGYKFENATILKNTFSDENYNDVEKFKSLMFAYKKGDERIMLSADKYYTEFEETREAIAEIDGIKLYYNQYTNKLVSPDYKLTEEDKQAEESGEIVFSYGDAEPGIMEVQNLDFKFDGIEYCFTKMDGDMMSADELIRMAAEIINN